MKMKVKTHSFFNMGTQRALYESEDGYVSKEFYIAEHIEKIQKKYNLDRIFRLDLGQNSDGCDEDVSKEFLAYYNNIVNRMYIKNYPEFVCRELRQNIAKLHNIRSDWVSLSAGLDQMLITISATFLELNDKIMVNAPSFYLFEDYSKRMGAIPIRLYLKEENDFKWTASSVDEYIEILGKLSPKIIWIANPNNPTGSFMPHSMLKDIIKAASDHYCFIVIDEAYGEYTDSNENVISASKYLYDYNNLMVLRTFSKGYGLANLRIGYAMVNNEDIINALRIHRPYYPITQFSFDFAKIALNKIDYLQSIREKVAIRKQYFSEHLHELGNFSYIDTDTSIMMIKNNNISASLLMKFLEKHGIFVARVPGDDYISEKYIRITLGKTEELEYLLEVLKSL